MLLSRPAFSKLKSVRDVQGLNPWHSCGRWRKKGFPCPFSTYEEPLKQRIQPEKERQTEDPDDRPDDTKPPAVHPIPGTDPVPLPDLPWVPVPIPPPLVPPPVGSPFPGIPAPPFPPLPDLPLPGRQPEPDEQPARPGYTLDSPGTPDLTGIFPGVRDLADVNIERAPDTDGQIRSTPVTVDTPITVPALPGTKEAGSFQPNAVLAPNLVSLDLLNNVLVQGIATDIIDSNAKALDQALISALVLGQDQIRQTVQSNSTSGASPGSSSSTQDLTIESMETAEELVSEALKQLAPSSNATQTDEQGELGSFEPLVKAIVVGAAIVTGAKIIQAVIGGGPGGGGGGYHVNMTQRMNELLSMPGPMESEDFLNYEDVSWNPDSLQAAEDTRGDY